jgi:myo-inositol-1(or 4)-monophosphatase
MTTDPGSLLPVALRAADIASELMRTRRPASVTEKHDRDVVSDVDIAIERQVRSLLGEATPEIGFLGEEEGRTGDPAAGWVWTLDPIDGTSNFAHGIPLCATSLALLCDGDPVVAVIDAPFLGQRYHAVQGQGAWAGDRRLSVSGTRHLRDAVVAVGDYATGPGADRENEGRLAVTVALAPRVHRLRMIGTAALDLAWVAEGRLDASITLGSKPWDTAAGALLAREAGASVVDADGGPHRFESDVAIAAPPGLVSQLLLLVRASILSDLNERDQAAVGRSPYAALDEVLRASRYLIFDFDGPVCDLAAAMPSDLTDRLRALIEAETSWPSALRPGADDPHAVLNRAASVSDALAARVDTKLTSAEMTAVAGAVPAGHIHDVVAACRDSGRVPAIVSSRSASAVQAWLTRYGLADQIRHICAPGGYPPGHLQPLHQLISQAVRDLGADPAECALITAGKPETVTASSAGLYVIGYARTVADHDRLTSAGATAIIPSLADLTLRLRARPLPQ